MGRPNPRCLLARTFPIVLLKTLLLLCDQAHAQCKIVKCNTEYVAAISNAKTANKNGVYCEALRSYSQCTRNTARTCRGDLVYHSAVHIIEDRMIQYNCSKAGPTTPPRRLPPPPSPNGPMKQACDYEKIYRDKHGEEPRYVHCGVFGDPHVRTFRGDFQTCSVKGSWPLLDNDYLFVQATSSPVSPASNATATTKLTIIFKNMKQCTEQKVFRAEVGHLPGAFDDGSVSGGRRVGGGGSSLTIHERDPGRYVEIRATHIGTILRIRQHDAQLSLSLRMAEEISRAYPEERDLQLCVTGCPTGQWLARTEEPRGAPRMELEAARGLCGLRLTLRDLYFQSCVFDLMISGNPNLTSAAFLALQDARELHPEPATLHIYSHAWSRRIGTWLPWLCSLLILVM